MALPRLFHPVCRGVLRDQTSARGTVRPSRLGPVTGTGELDIPDSLSGGVTVHILMMAWGHRFSVSARYRVC